MNQTKQKSVTLFLVSLILLGLGISLVTSSQLGTTSITSAPYVLSLSFPLSFGVLTMLTNFLFVLIQLLILGKEFPRLQWLQLLVGPVLGVSIDMWSYFINYMSYPNYPIQLLIVLSGCFIIAYSTVLQLKAQVVNNPAEGIVKVLALKTDKSFGTVKLYFDISLVSLAVLLSLFFLGKIEGVREGTLISALLIGPLIRRMQNPSLIKVNPGRVNN